MHGEIIYYDQERGLGFINGGDGNRYVFDREDLGDGGTVSKGTRVEFSPQGDRARSITWSGRPAVEPQIPRPDMPAYEPGGATIAAPVGPGTGQPSTSLFGYFRRGITRNYANFRGRARRKEYWGFILFATILTVVALVAGAAAGAAMGSVEAEDPTFILIALGLCMLVLFVPSLAITVRRQHDIGLSGWFILLMLIPTVGSLIILVFALMPSQKHGNRWGPVPAGNPT